MLNNAHRLDEAASDVQVPAAIRDYVDAYCRAINNMSSYNEDKWDRGTGGAFFMYSKPSSAYADLVMQGVRQNYNLTKEQVEAVYQYVEFEEPADWYDDPAVKNEFVSLDLDKSSDQFSVYKKYLSSLCRELNKKYGIAMSRQKNVGRAEGEHVAAVVKCEKGSYAPILTIQFRYGDLESLKLTSDISKDADTISNLMSKHNNIVKAFWVKYHEFIGQVTGIVNATQYMRLDSESTKTNITIEYSDGREKNHRFGLNPELIVIRPNVANGVGGATVFFITPEKLSFGFGPYEFSASKWSEHKHRNNYDASGFKNAVNDIKSFLTRYDIPTSQWETKTQVEALNSAHRNATRTETDNEFDDDM